MKHVNTCPAVQGYNKLKFAVYVCTTVVGAFVALLLYLGPGAFENAMNKGVNKALEAKMPSIRSYIQEQVVITTHQFQTGRPFNFDTNLSPPWQVKQP